MNSVWYCTDCETRIGSDEIDDHETQGHHVKGQLQPDRLLGNDPHNVTVLTSGEGDDGLGDATTDWEGDDEPDNATTDREVVD